MTLKEYFDALTYHDWFYDYSDDYNVYLKGKANRDMLYRQSETDEIKKKMYNDFVKYKMFPLDGNKKPMFEDYL